MDPLFDSVTVVVTDIERNYFLFVLFLTLNKESQFFCYNTLSDFSDVDITFSFSLSG